MSTLILMALASAASVSQGLVFALGVALVLAEGLLVDQGVVRRRIQWANVSQAVATVLVALTLVLLFRAVSLRASLPAIPMPAASALATATGRPDIVVVLADGHGRGDVLAKDYGYDMQPLRSTLLQLGFVESPDSHANHTNTRFSLSVLLNGRPMSELGQDLSKAVDEAIPAAAVAASTDLALLRLAGYRIVTLTSGYSELRIGEPGEVVDVGPWNELEQTVVDGSLVGHLLDPGRSARVTGQRERIRREASYLVDLARQPASTTPLFAFVHMSAPHPPMVFEADCTPRPVDHLTDRVAGEGLGPDGERAIAAQRDQTACVDAIVAQALSDIVAARPQAVVILLSDHGPDELLDWNQPSPRGMDARFGNLFWARTPGETGVFPNDVSLVNVMPILLDHYLGSALPLHANDLFFGPTEVDAHYVPYSPTEAIGTRGE